MTGTKIAQAIQDLDHNIKIYFLRMWQCMQTQQAWHGMSKTLEACQNRDVEHEIYLPLPYWHVQLLYYVSNRIMVRHGTCSPYHAEDEDVEIPQDQSELTPEKTPQHDAWLWNHAVDAMARTRHDQAITGIRMGSHVMAIAKIYELDHDHALALQFIMDMHLARCGQRRYRNAMDILIGGAVNNDLYNGQASEIIASHSGVAVTQALLNQWLDRGMITKLPTDTNNNKHFAVPPSPWWPELHRMHMQIMENNQELDFAAVAACFATDFQSSMTWQDLAHQPQVGIMADLVEHALQARTPGINILLYGEPGTGKTETVYALAREHQWQVLTVGESNADATPQQRVEDLFFVQSFIKHVMHDQRVVILFDEMQDFLTYAEDNKLSKNRWNRMLEQCALPVFWTSNGIKDFDAALMRRMTLAQRFDVPTVRMRQQLWHKLRDQHAMKLTDQDVRNLAHAHAAVPAIMTSTAWLAQALDLDVAGMSQVMTGKLVACNAGRDVVAEHATPAVHDYDFDLAHASMDLRQLVDNIVAGASGSFAMCCYGEPGTGKTAFVQYLAHELNMPTLVINAATLQSSFVGETEKNIQRAFQRAHDESAMLIFDEVDSMLQDRRSAQRSWEISQVNQLLVEIERCRQPLACTTNLMSSLDAAAMRRFTFKIQFKSMTHAAMQQACRKFLNVELDIPRHWQLATGDFIAVQRQLAVMPAQSCSAILALLEQEYLLKPHATRPMGF